MCVKVLCKDDYIHILSVFVRGRNHIREYPEEFDVKLYLQSILWRALYTVHYCQLVTQSLRFYQIFEAA